MATVLDIGPYFFSKKLLSRSCGFCDYRRVCVSIIPIFKIIWFYFFQTNYTLEDIQYFYPLSALNIVDYKELEP
jgi:hypothetical protein